MAIFNNDHNNFPDVPCVCFACGNKAAAFWTGTEQNIAVCKACAVEILPKLAADAVAGPLIYAHANQTASAAWEKMEKNYWHSMFLATLHAHNNEMERVTGIRASR